MLKVEIASTPRARESGLMFRNSMEDDQGMLFIFNRAEVLKFWGMNTYMPLDIAFVNPDMQIVKIARIRSMDLTGVSSDVECLMAIEANDGYFSKNNIKAGCSIALVQDRDDGPLLKFL